LRLKASVLHRSAAEKTDLSALRFCRCAVWT